LVAEDVSDVTDGVGESEGCVEGAVDGDRLLVVELGRGVVAEVSLDLAEAGEGLGEVVVVLLRAGVGDGFGENAVSVGKALLGAGQVALLEEGRHADTLAVGCNGSDKWGFGVVQWSMVRRVWMLGLVMVGTAAAQTGKPCPTDGSAKPKGCVAAADKSPGNAFPYPGDPEAPKTVAPTTAPVAAPDAPQAPAAPAGSPSDKFPYPGEVPAAPKAGGAGDKFPYPGETPPNSGSSSSSSSSSSSGGDDPAAAPDDKGPLKDEGTTGSTKSSRRRLRPPAQKVLSDPEREDEDLTVAKFYVSRGNLQGAYLRGKDAVKTQPDDPDGHWLLADVADKMGKKDEAVTEYEAYLKLDPDGDHVKAAKAALAKLK
jgi:hypothetical protein